MLHDRCHPAGRSTETRHGVEAKGAGMPCATQPATVHLTTVANLHTHSLPAPHPCILRSSSRGGALWASTARHHGPTASCTGWWRCPGPQERRPGEREAKERAGVSGMVKGERVMEAVEGAMVVGERGREVAARGIEAGVATAAEERGRRA